MRRAAAPRFVFLVVGASYRGTAGSVLARIERLPPDVRYGGPLIERLD